MVNHEGGAEVVELQKHRTVVENMHTKKNVVQQLPAPHLLMN